MNRASKNLLMFGCILAFGRTGFPQSEQASSKVPNLHITVHVFNFDKLSLNTLQQAEAVAAYIFRQAGVETAWRDCSPSSPPVQNLPACPTAFGPTEFVLRIHLRDRAAQAGFPASWLGFALPPGEAGGRSSQASVFFDRVLDLANKGDAAAPVVLAHAMAHELGHLLMPGVGHTPSGLMCGKWGPKDMLLAAQGGMHFTSPQVEIIRAEVSTRTGLQQANTPPAIAARKELDSPFQ